jgi:hypothetical protein
MPNPKISKRRKRRLINFMTRHLKQATVMVFASLVATHGSVIFCTVRGVRAMQLRHRRSGLFWMP